MWALRGGEGGFAPAVCGQLPLLLGDGFAVLSQCRSYPGISPRCCPPVGTLVLAKSWYTSPGGRYPAGTVILFSMSNEKTDCIVTCTSRELVLLVLLIAYVASIVFGVEWPSMF